MDQSMMDQIKPFAGFGSQGQSGVQAGIDLANQSGPLQQVKTAYTTAVSVQKPRSIAIVASNVLQESALAGARFFYRWTVKTKSGDKVIIGPSIDLAMCCIRHYGNCAMDLEVDETPTHYIFKSTLIDLESGFTFPRLFRQRKRQAIGKFDQDRQEDIVFQIGQSKAVRNTIKNVVPAWLIEKAIEEAYQAELASIKPENIAAARAKCLAFFASYGATADQLQEKIGKEVNQWSEDDIMTLRGMATALKEGRVDIAELFPFEQPTTESDQDRDQARETSKQSTLDLERKFDPNWKRDAWTGLKSPGLKAHAELFKDTFKDLPLVHRIEFAKKWDRCKDLGAFPFDADGNWIGAKAQAAHIGEPPQDDEKTNPVEGEDQDFDTWLQVNYPKVDAKILNQYLRSKAEKANIPISVYEARMMKDIDYTIKILDGANAEHIATQTDGKF